MLMGSVFIPCIACIVLVTLCGTGTCEDPIEVTIDAAYTSRSFLYLIANGNVMYVDLTKRKELLKFQMYTPDELTKLDIQAAFSTFDISYLEVLFYGKNRGLDVQLSGGDTVKKIKYGRNKKFLNDGKGPDAAAKYGDKVYFFKRCKMATRVSKRVWTKSTDIKKGLPCNMDAAWNNGDGMIVLKGDQIWRWSENDTVTIAENFHDRYNIKSWVLKPKPLETN